MAEEERKALFEGAGLYDRRPARDKFAGFAKLIEAARRGEIDRILIAYPEVLGDTYEEVIRNLTSIARVGIGLTICGWYEGDEYRPPEKYEDDGPPAGPPVSAKQRKKKKIETYTSHS